MFSSALFLLLVSAGVVLALPPPPGNKIFGGQTVNISTVPWQVALLANGTYRCGGTIISTRWILTAAHCTPEEDATILGVRVGSEKHAIGGQHYDIEEVVNHEKFIHYSKDDISVLKTKTDIVLSDKVAIATLPDQNEAPPAIDETLKVSGWGAVDKIFEPDDLYAVDIKLLDFSRCAKQYDYYNLDENLQLCAGSHGQGTCIGDSGGPLVHGNRVVGVVSFGGPCGKSPEVYTRVSGYRDWIKEKTGL